MAKNRVRTWDLNVLQYAMMSIRIANRPTGDQENNMKSISNAFNASGEWLTGKTRQFASNGRPPYTAVVAKLNFDASSAIALFGLIVLLQRLKNYQGLFGANGGRKGVKGRRLGGRILRRYPHVGEKSKN